MNKIENKMKNENKNLNTNKIKSIKIVKKNVKICF